MIALKHSEVKGRTRETVRLFLQDASGATVIEYALIAGIVSVSIVGLTRTVGLEITRLFEVVIQSFPNNEPRMIQLAIGIFFAVLTIYAGLSDIFTMTIPNRISLLLAGGFVLAALIVGLPGEQFSSASQADQSF